MSRFVLVFSFLFLMGGCSQFHTGRSFLSEMEQEDGGFFEPTEDFPVVAGDTGRYWESEGERRQRTPASDYDKAQWRANKLLERELRQLENSQSDISRDFYEKYEHKFSTVSEKIYFLKLPPYERKDYLIARGFYEAPKRSLNPQNRLMASTDNDVSMGMKKDDVVASLGHPARVEIAGNPQNENERWLYQTNGASKYIYFEAGTVQGWE